MMLHNANNNQV